MKKIAFALLLMVMTAACSSDKFKIDGNVVNLEDGAVHVVFSADSGVVDQWVEVDKKGHFTFKGVSSQPVLVTLSGKRGEPLATLVAVNGDHLKVKGDGGKSLSVRVKGNSLNEEWQLFRDEHRAFYADPNPSRLDAAIDKLLRGIEIQARPESLTGLLYGNEKDRKRAVLPRLMSLTLFKHGGKFEEIKLTDKTSILSLWANPQNSRNALINKLQTLDKGIRIIDVLTESDSLRWHQTIAGDPADWQHYWAPGGPMEQGVQMLGIKSLPWFAVTDSTGLVVYSGPNCDLASKKASELIR